MMERKIAEVRWQLPECAWLDPKHVLPHAPSPICEHILPSLPERGASRKFRRIEAPEGEHMLSKVFGERVAHKGRVAFELEDNFTRHATRD